MGQCGITSSKTVLVFLNLIFWVSGAAARRKGRSRRGLQPEAGGFGPRLRRGVVPGIKEAQVGREAGAHRFSPRGLLAQCGTPVRAARWRALFLCGPRLDPDSVRGRVPLCLSPAEPRQAILADPQGAAEPSKGSNFKLFVYGEPVGNSSAQKRMRSTWEVKELDQENRCL